MRSKKAAGGNTAENNMITIPVKLARTIPLDWEARQLRLGQTTGVQVID
jgi:hypothetical protein